MTLGVLISVAPLLALVLALALRRYPGERTIQRLRSRRATSARRRRAPALAPQPRCAPLLPRGGRLVAAAVASRPPPGG